MEKPTPEQFDVTEKHLVKFKGKDELFSWRLFYVCTVGGIVIGIITGLSAGNIFLALFYGFLGLPMGILFSLFGSALIVGLYSPVLRLISPTYRKVYQYKKAKEAFDAWWVRTQYDYWFSLSGRRFEQELAYLYSQFGYDIALTPASGDQGIDIVLNKDGREYIVQCKAHKKPIGPAVARELYGTLLHSKADEAILASLVGCTAGTKDFIRDKPIKLISLPDILLMQKTIGENS